MNRFVIAVVGVVLLLASVAFAQPRRTKVRPTPKPAPAKVKGTLPPKPPPDPISGDWNAAYQYQDLRIPFKMHLTHDNGKVSGDVTDSHGIRRITDGNWSAG